ncbi:Crp/Fnr family transcriptional regulator [Verticiella alkaliphila]|uniref:Crp/Fnr family transcriptional regulator n=1 Tax=Verticiella alkaliphila TaxID=2779529 RepID=UPI00209AAD7B|nr:Crp/Fnr family transcriptional regulator [Verticiella sp. GG226]
MAGRSTYAAWDAARELGAAWFSRPDLGRTRAVKAGDVLYAQGDRHGDVYLVRSGVIHTHVVRPDGSSLLLEIFGPGAIFGEASAFLDTPRYVTATAVTSGVVTQVGAQALQAAFAVDPSLAVSLIQLLGIKHRGLIGKLLSFTGDSPQVRVAGLLARLAQTDPAVRLTHAQLACMAGLSRVSVTRALKGLSDDGLIATHSRAVEVRDAAGLRQRAGLA